MTYDTLTDDKDVAKAVFAGSLKRIRRELSFSQDDLAEALTVSVETIKNWENSKKATMPNHSVYYMRLAKLSGWPLEKVMKGTLQDESGEFANMPREARVWHPLIRQFSKEQIKMLDNLDAKLKSGDNIANILNLFNKRKTNQDQE